MNLHVFVSIKTKYVWRCHKTASFTLAWTLPSNWICTVSYCTGWTSVFMLNIQILGAMISSSLSISNWPTWRSELFFIFLHSLWSWPTFSLLPELYSIQFGAHSIPFQPNWAQTRLLLWNYSLHYEKQSKRWTITISENQQIIYLGPIGILILLHS